MPTPIEAILLVMCLSILYLTWVHHTREQEWDRRFKSVCDAFFTTERVTNEKYIGMMTTMIEMEGRLRSLESLRDSTILKRPFKSVSRAYP